VGVTVVLSLYFVLIMRIVQNAQTAGDRSGMYVLYGSSSSVAVSHAGKTSEWVVDECCIPAFIPFMSAGGSTTIPTFTSM